jgi:hypothetical protein
MVYGVCHGAREDEDEVGVRLWVILWEMPSPVERVAEKGREKRRVFRNRASELSEAGRQTTAWSGVPVTVMLALLPLLYHHYWGLFGRCFYSTLPSALNCILCCLSTSRPITTHYHQATAPLTLSSTWRSQSPRVLYAKSRPPASHVAHPRRVVVLGCAASALPVE